MNFEKYTERARGFVQAAQNLAMREGHPQLQPGHLLKVLLDDPEGLCAGLIDRAGGQSRVALAQTEAWLARQPKVSGNAAPPQATRDLVRLFDTAEKAAEKAGDSYVTVERLLLAIAVEKDTEAGKALAAAGVTAASLNAAINALRKGRTADNASAENAYDALKKYARDLTEAAREGKLDPVIGRDEEIRRTVQVLSRRTKNNPVLIGEPGVGKTAIVEGLAQKIASNDIPEILSGKRVVALDLGSMIAGSRFRGEFEERLKAVMDEVQRARGEIIMMIDELHTVIGAGAAQGAMDASNMLKPALARGELQCIGATTLDEYHKHIEKDAALERRFAPIYVEEPSVDDTIKMLMGLRDRYEAHHKVHFADEALEAAAHLADRYVTDRHLPDKAIDLMDEAAAKLRVALYSLPPDLKATKNEIDRLRGEEEQAGIARDYEQAAQKKSERLRIEEEFGKTRDKWESEHKLDEVVDVDDIAEVVHQWTGIPLSQMMESESQKLLQMEERLHERIIGQEEAIHAISDAIRRARSGLKDPSRPIGSFIFIGPSGVGKTELAKALAWFMFDDEDSLVRIDMSEYHEQHTVSRLFGAPPGYIGYEEGGQLTEAVRRRPYRVLLFDEIEKAHPEVWNALLQILDDGRMTDGQGNVVDFRNTIIIMTSNLGTEYVRKGGALGFAQKADTDEERESHEKIEKALKGAFRPEFLNRIDEIIMFSPLSLKEMEKIVELQMKEIQDRLIEHNITVQLSDAARGWLAKEGYDPAFGARPLKRALQKHVESPLSMKLLAGEFPGGATVMVEVDEKKNALTFTAGEALAPKRKKKEAVAA